mmetsp:Transcript_3143/g.4643  ORF Transcript_3143/g.4643 Transcript_3143/m.4643 type:complete len:89 (+) Transcript_3143:789-1055(+)
MHLYSHQTDTGYVQQLHHASKSGIYNQKKPSQNWYQNPDQMQKEQNQNVYVWLGPKTDLFYTLVTLMVLSVYGVYKFIYKSILIKKNK